MYKKSDARTKLLFSQSQPVAFLLFSLPLPSLLLIIGTLRSEDGDGSENVAEKVNSRSLNLHLWEIMVFMALAEINYYFCCAQLWARDFSEFFAPSEVHCSVVVVCRGTYFSNLSQSLSPYNRPPYTSDRKQYEDLVYAYENWTQGSLPRKDLNSCTFWKRIHCMKFLVYQMCKFMLSMKVLRILWLVYIQRT